VNPSIDEKKKFGSVAPTYVLVGRHHYRRGMPVGIKVCSVERGFDKTKKEYNMNWV